jgi:hypothetical protein
MGIAAMAEAPCRVLRGDGGQHRAERFVQRVRGAGGDAAQLGAFTLAQAGSIGLRSGEEAGR